MIKNERLKYKYIAIDFDGTIAVEDNWPIIGEEITNAGYVIRKIKEYGGQVSIWTCRSGNDLDNAIEWLRENDIPFDYINQDFPEISNNFIGFTRKIYAEIYIDNKDIHCLGNGGINWPWIHDQIFENTDISYMER